MPGAAVGRSRQAMKTVRLRPRLGILFVLAVGLPSAALVVMAIRSITGEEAILEKRLERTLGAELDHVVTLVADAMHGVREELGRSAPADTGSRGQAALAGVESLVRPRRRAVPAHGRRPAGGTGPAPAS